MSRAAAVPRGTLRLWLVAARPRTLPAAIAPVTMAGMKALKWANSVPQPIAPTRTEMAKSGLQ